MAPSIVPLPAPTTERQAINDLMRRPIRVFKPSGEIETCHAPADTLERLFRLWPSAFSLESRRQIVADLRRDGLAKVEDGRGAAHTIVFADEPKQ
jgi:hypothetical protein